jgi:hypothetical protein
MQKKFNPDMTTKLDPLFSSSTSSSKRSPSMQMEFEIIGRGEVKEAKKHMH